MSDSPCKSNETTEGTATIKPGLAVATIPIAALVIFLGVNVFLFQGDPHIPLVLATAVTALVGWRLKCSWGMMESGLVKGIEIGLKPILILLVVGILIGTWIMSGIVPTIIYYGLQVFDPQLFLAAACLICAIVSISTGSSWTTAGTVGVAMIGVGNALGVPVEMVAGAIVSGAYLGDKMSPLSDTTNLAPAVAGAELFDHIRYMTLTAVPAFLLSLVIYGVIGLMLTGEEMQGDKILLIQETLSAHFNLNPLLLLAPLLVILMVIFRIPALPALAAGAALGGLLAMLLQGSSPESIAQVAHYGYEPDTKVEAVNELLRRGGLDSMMFTVSLILCALSFGGLMEATGMLAAIAESVLKMAHTTGRLIASTAVTCVGMNIIAPDQYLSIAVPGRMYQDAYARQNLHPKVLSRTLEDAGTLTSPLVPWNTCGAFMAGALAVSPAAYLPYAFLNLITPVLAILYGCTGWKIAKLTSGESSTTRNASRAPTHPRS